MSKPKAKPLLTRRIGNFTLGKTVITVYTIRRCSWGPHGALPRMVEAWNRKVFNDIYGCAKKIYISNELDHYNPFIYGLQVYWF